MDLKEGSIGTNIPQSGQSKISPEGEENTKVVNPTRKLMKYMRKELTLFIIGSIALIGGSLGELINPYYIGMFVDNLNQKKYDKVYTLCWQLALIVLVSPSFLPSPQFQSPLTILFESTRFLFNFRVNQFVCLLEAFSTI